MNISIISMINVVLIDILRIFERAFPGIVYRRKERRWCRDGYCDFRHFGESQPLLVGSSVWYSMYNRCSLSTSNQDFLLMCVSIENYLWRLGAVCVCVCVFAQNPVSLLKILLQQRGQKVGRYNSSWFHCP
jgi:hypothetical protein